MDGAHAHLLLNHVPGVATGIAAFLLLLALLRHNEQGFVKAALVVLLVAGAGTFAAYLTGVPAEEQMEKISGIDEHLIHAHHDRAWIAALLSALPTVGAAVAWITSRRRAVSITPTWAVLLLLLSVVAIVGLLWASSAGGVIRHPELR
jgi:glucan phosphoethanolaminetransferase (alkaline phosphatase superfamily)